MLSLGYIVLGILAISFLIFIHELGHYFMARKVGMRVETFAIGFGKPIFAWSWNGERWQVGWILFGGYVKIAGMDEEPNRDPYTVSDGFFGKSPWDRIKVAFMGPLVNILFALFAFSFLWVGGGREKDFSNYTHKLGWVDPKSELYAQGVRPGDEIHSYNEYPLRGASDHLYAPMTSGGTLIVKGNHVDYTTGYIEPFAIELEPYPHPSSLDKGILTSGVMAPASYVIYDKKPDGGENPLLEGSPLEASGIQYGDRIVWVDGEQIFSIEQLNQIINDERALVTVQRDGQTLLFRVPRVQAQELRLDPLYREELTDWQFEAGLNNKKLRELWTIPYDLDNNGTVQARIRFIDKEVEEELFPANMFSSMEQPLLPGDKIIAVDGTPVDQSFKIIELLQKNQINIIVQRGGDYQQTISWQEADSDFDRRVDWKSLEKIADSIGTGHLVTKSGDYRLLDPVVPQTISEFNFPEDRRAEIAAGFERQRAQIEEIDDPEARTAALEALNNLQDRLLIGLPNNQDLKVDYNPIPTDLFGDVFGEISRTLRALFTGSMSPKYLSGPVGIIQVVHDRSMVSYKEAIFWMGAISLNLGVLNLLPIPMLDGGTIVFNLIEIITRRRLSPKLMEKFVLPFAVLLIGFFIFVTYHDLSRIISNFWR